MPAWDMSCSLLYASRPKSLVKLAVGLLALAVYKGCDFFFFFFVFNIRIRPNAMAKHKGCEHGLSGKFFFLSSLQIASNCSKFL